MLINLLKLRRQDPEAAGALAADTVVCGPGSGSRPAAGASRQVAADHACEQDPDRSQTLSKLKPSRHTAKELLCVVGMLCMS